MRPLTIQTALMGAMLLTPLLGAETHNIDIGMIITPFNANTDQGALWRLSDHLADDQYLVIYFYPAAMTGGCTAQACAYRDISPQFKQLDVEVVGISGDSVQGLQVFKEAYNLNFTLLSDVNGTLAQRFGVPYGDGGSLLRKVNDQEVTLNRGQSISRWTFVLNAQGQVVFKDTQVNAGQDANKVLDFIRRQKIEAKGD